MSLTGISGHTGKSRPPLPALGLIAVSTLLFVAAAVSLRQMTITLAFIGIIAKIGLFVWVSHTSDWTVGTSTLAGVTLFLGILTMVLAVIDLVRSGGNWLPLVAFMLGLLTFAPVIGYSA
ncbi:MAG: hypothetical protein IVW55_16580 [Chloroflexi bacterium]|nr:hypothetical protein [Chloroflexota bacterium]